MTLDLYFPKADPSTCNKCGKQMSTKALAFHAKHDRMVPIIKDVGWVCKNPLCPTFSLLQIPSELM